MDLTEFASKSFSAKSWINETFKRNTEKQIQGENATTELGQDGDGEKTSMGDGLTQKKIKGSSSLQVEDQIIYSNTLMTRLQLLSDELFNSLENNFQHQFVSSKLPQAVLEMNQMFLTGQQLSDQIHQLIHKMSTLSFPDHQLQKKFSNLQQLHDAKSKLEIVLKTLIEAKTLNQTLIQLEKDFSTLFISSSNDQSAKNAVKSTITSSDSLNDKNIDNESKLDSTQNVDNKQSLDIEYIASKIHSCKNGCKLLKQYQYDQMQLQKVQKLEKQLEVYISPKLCQLLISRKNSDGTLQQYMKALLQTERLEHVLSTQYIPQLIEMKKLNNKQTELGTLYEMVGNVLYEEIPWIRKNCEKYFDIGEWIILPFVSKVFTFYHQQPSKPVYESNVPQLIDRYKQSLQFLENIKQIVVTSTSNGQESSSLQNCFSTIMRPFKTYQDIYPDLEREYLMKKIDYHAHQSNMGSLHDVIESMRECESIIFSEFDKSLYRCMIFTGGTKFHGLLKSMCDILIEYGRKINKSLQKYCSIQTIPSDLVQNSLQLLKLSVNLLNRVYNFSHTTKSFISEKSKNASLQDMESIVNIPVLFQQVQDALQKNILQVAEQILGDVLMKPIRDKLSEDVRNHYEIDPYADSPYELPDFHSLPALDYILTIGEHLVTLPKNLDVLLDHSQNVDSDASSTLSESEDPSQQSLLWNEKIKVRYWLDMICQQTLRHLLDKILEREGKSGLKNVVLSSPGSRQLAADITHIIQATDLLDYHKHAKDSTYDALRNIVELYGATTQSEYDQKVQSLRLALSPKIISIITTQKQMVSTFSSSHSSNK